MYYLCATNESKYVYILITIALVALDKNKYLNRDGQSLSAASSIDEKEFSKAKMSVFSSIDLKPERSVSSSTSSSVFDEAMYFQVICAYYEEFMSFCG